jgi:hypothetical protein
VRLPFSRWKKSRRQLPREVSKNSDRAFDSRIPGISAVDTDKILMSALRENGGPGAMRIPAALARFTSSIKFTFAGSSHQRMKLPFGRYDSPMRSLPCLR